MADGVLGQGTIAAATNVDLYTVPGAKKALVRVSVCERNAVAATVRIAIRYQGNTLNTGHYIAYDHALAANGINKYGPFIIGEGDVITIYASTADTSWIAHGMEQAIQ